MRRTNLITTRLSGVLIASLLAVSCAEQSTYVDRIDTVSFGAGNAMAHNRAIHAEDPWPAGVEDTSIPADGARMQKVIEKYKKGPAEEDAGGGGGILTLMPAGADAQGQ